MRVAVLKETHPGERRVALVPGSLAPLTKAGVEIVVEAGAGAWAGYPDAEYAARGAQVAPDRAGALATADVVAMVRPLGGDRPLEGLRAGQVVVGFLDPLARPENARRLAGAGLTAFALELIPRTTRAQAMDVLSSAATIVGYKAVLLAAGALPRMFPMMMTAGGTLAPARLFVIGGGVAGLQAIATARKLGGVVQAYDIRPAVKEQVQSLGAKFVELPLEAGETQDAGGYARAMDEAFYRKQRELMGRVVAASDVVIATAAVPGRKAPVLVTREQVEAMPPGSVVVDVAAEQGGNCEVTVAGETIAHHGVTVMGPVNLAASVPYHASQMHGKNVAAFLALLVRDKALRIDTADDIVRETLVAREGEVVSPRVREALGLPAPAAAGA